MDITYKSVWEDLSKVNVNQHTQKKMNLTFLSWAWAWGVMMEKYPQHEYEFKVWTANEKKYDVGYYPDGSASVECTVNIGDLSRTMWLPVMDHRNNSIANPSSRQISDTKMRCLVKCYAMYGLGHYIYAGEDIPSEPKGLSIKHQEQIAKEKANG